MANKSRKDEKDVGIGDVIKKVVSIGVGAAFMTEDAVKNILSDLPLPKEIISGLIKNAKGAKEDFAQSLREEVRGYLSRVDPSTLVEDVINRYDFEINATIKLKKKDRKIDGEIVESEEE